MRKLKSLTREMNWMVIIVTQAREDYGLEQGKA
jgi:hypothetical protein